jgi:ABC-type uncharacterized transport system involved in gliding motility auxiliary subunit
MQNKKIPPVWVRISRFGIIPGLLLLTGGMALTTVSMPPLSDGGLLSPALCIAGGLLILSGLTLNFTHFVRRLKRRGFIRELNSIGTIVLAVTITALVCYISAHYFSRIDMTGQRKFSLHSKTKNILRNLDTPVTVTIAYQEPSGSEMKHDPRARLLRWGYQQARDMLDEFEIRSTNISVEELDLSDAERVRQITSQFDIPGRCIIFQSSRAHEIIPLVEIVESPVRQDSPLLSEPPNFRGEAAFASALLKIIEDRKQKIYFLTGHGERPIASAESTTQEADSNGGILSTSRQFSMSNLVQKIKEDNFLVEQLDLSRSGMVPEDCDLLVIAGPRVPLPERHVEAVKNYLGTPGGRLLIMVDSLLQNTDAEVNINSLLHPYGIEAHTQALGMSQSAELRWDKGGITQARTASSTLPIRRDGYFDHIITRSLLPYNLFLTSVAPLKILDPGPHPGIRVKKLITSNKSSWEETSVIENMEDSEFDRENDIPGPVLAGVVIESSPAARNMVAEEGEAATAENELMDPKIAVFGTSESFTDAMTSQNRANLYLLLNTVNWLADKQYLTGIPPRTIDINLIEVKKRHRQVARWVFGIAIPMCIVLAGMAVWQVRRR